MKANLEMVPKSSVPAEAEITSTSGKIFTKNNVGYFAAGVVAANVVPRIIRMITGWLVNFGTPRN